MSQEELSILISPLPNLPPLPNLEPLDRSQAGEKGNKTWGNILLCSLKCYCVYLKKKCLATLSKKYLYPAFLLPIDREFVLKKIRVPIYVVK